MKMIRRLITSQCLSRRTPLVSIWSPFLRPVSNSSAKDQIQELLNQTRASKQAQRPTLELYLTRVAERVGTDSELAISDVRRVLHACSKLRKEPTELLKDLLERIGPELMSSAQPTDLSLILYSLASFQRRSWLFENRKLRDEVLERVLLELNQPIRIADFNAVDLTQVVYSLALLNRKEEKLMNNLRSMLSSHSFVVTFKGRECANLLWAFAKMDYKDHEILDLFSKRVVECWTMMTNREKAMTIWSWGIFGFAFRSYLQSTLHLTFDDQTRILSFEIRQLSTILVSLARLKVKNDWKLVQRIVDQVLEMMEKEVIGEQSLANIIWSLGHLNYYNPFQMDPLIEQATKSMMLPRFTSQGLCNVLIGLALMEAELTDSIEILIQEILEPSRLPFFKNQELAMINWSLGKLKFHQVTSLEKLMTLTTQSDKIKEYTIKELSAILTGWVGMYMRDQVLIFKLIEEALNPKRVQKMNADDLSLILWTMGCLELKITLFYERIFTQLQKDNRIRQLQFHGLVNALIGFKKAKFDNSRLQSWIRDILEHWRVSGKLQKIKNEDLESIVSLLGEFDHIDPALVSLFSKELTQKESMEYGPY